MSEIRERLENETELGAHIGDGWWPAVEHAAWLLDHAYPGWKPVQIKEKFGNLRFYIDPAPFREKRNDDAEDDLWYDTWTNRWVTEQEAIVTAAERACVDVCEICGEPGKLIYKNWVHTLCPEHEEKG